MISVKKLFGPNRLAPYCGDCRIAIPGWDTYCNCGKYNEELQALYDKDPEAYRECFLSETTTSS